MAKGTVAAALPFFLFLLFLSVSVALLPAKNAGYLLRMFRSHARTDMAGEYPALAENMAGYLGNEISTPETDAVVYSEKELLHLRDVKALFRLSDLLLAVSAALMMTCSLLFIRARILRRNRSARDLALAAMYGIAAVSAALAIAGLWAAADFNGAFRAFHEALFSNDLWLLNPDSDLLIMLMPEAFFTEYAVMAATHVGLLLIGLFGALFVLRKAIGGHG